MIRRYLAAVPLLGLGGDWLLSLRFQNQQKLERCLRDARPRTALQFAKLCAYYKCCRDGWMDGREDDSSHARCYTEA